VDTESAGGLGGANRCMWLGRQVCVGSQGCICIFAHGPGQPGFSWASTSFECSRSPGVQLSGKAAFWLSAGRSPTAERARASCLTRPRRPAGHAAVPPAPAAHGARVAVHARARRLGRAGRRAAAGRGRRAGRGAAAAGRALGRARGRGVQGARVPALRVPRPRVPARRRRAACWHGGARAGAGAPPCAAPRASTAGCGRGVLRQGWAARRWARPAAPRAPFRRNAPIRRYRCSCFSMVEQRPLRLRVLTLGHELVLSAPIKE